MENSPPLPKGTNVRIMLQHCQCELDWLLNADNVVPFLFDEIKKSGLTAIKETHHAFEGAGYTLAVILAESHVVIHTWPEHENLALIEISVCDFLRDNRERSMQLGKRISAIYQPEKSLTETTCMIPRLSEPNLPGNGFYAEIDDLIETRQSRFQSIVIADTSGFGRALLLDGVFQTTEADEYFYHEPLVHVPMLAHPEPRRVLICGGGDGGSAREVLRHPSVESCVIVDIDRDVIELAKKHLVAIHQGSLNHPNVKIVIQDAREFVQQTEEMFDVILMDTTDPGACANPLYTGAFYQSLKCRLNPGGFIGLHVGAPLSQPAASKQAADALLSVFPNTFPYLQFVPAYGTMLAFMCCFPEGKIPGAADELACRIETRSLDNLKIISPDTYHAMFAIPPFLRGALPVRSPQSLSVLP